MKPQDVKREDVTFQRLLEESMRVLDLRDPDDHGVKTVAVLLASAFVGTDEAKLAVFTGYDRALIDPVAANCRREGIWGEDGKIHASWFSDDGGGVALIADSLVANGLAHREKVER